MSSSGAGNLATRNETPLAGERVHGTNRKTRTKTDADDSEKNRHSSVLFIVEPNSRRKRKIYEKVRTMTLNIQTCSDKYEDRLDEICQLGSRKKLSIMVLTEFRRRGLDSREVRLEDGTTWDVYWTGFKSKREYGVAICLKRERKLREVSWEVIGGGEFRAANVGRHPTLWHQHPRLRSLRPNKLPRHQGQSSSQGHILA